MLAVQVVDMFILNDNPPAFYTFTEFRQDEYGGDGGQYNQTNASAAYEDPDMYSDQFDGGEPISVTWLMVTLMAAVG